MNESMDSDINHFRYGYYSTVIIWFSDQLELLYNRFHYKILFSSTRISINAIRLFAV